MSNEFELAGGTATGYTHITEGRANQDAYAHKLTLAENTTIAVVADGCSEGPRSEVGSYILAHVLLQKLAAGVRNFRSHKDALNFARSSTVRVLDTLLDHLAGEYALQAEKSAVILDCLLATVVVGLIGPEQATFAAIGDGFLAVNGEVVDLGTFPGNKPPYLAYELTISTMDPTHLRWNVLKQMPTADLRSFIVGTDGMRDFAEHEFSTMPRLTRPVGNISQFWEEDAFFKNKDAVRRRLVLCNGGVGLRAVGGLLHDDTTLIVGRRRPCSP